MKKLIVVAAVLALLPAASVRADTIDYVGTGLGLWGIQIAGPGFTYGPGGFAGQIIVNDTTTHSGNFAAYCLDASQYLSDPQTMTARPLNEATFPDGTNPIHARAGTGGEVAWLLNHYQGGGFVANANAGAALQMAIWEVLYEGSGALNVYGGDFTWVNAASYATAASLANTWLASIGTNTSEAIWLDWQPTVGTTHGQDFGVPVPEPGTMMLLGTGLIGVAALFRRRPR